LQIAVGLVAGSTFSFPRALPKNGRPPAVKPPVVSLESLLFRLNINFGIIYVLVAEIHHIMAMFSQKGTNHSTSVSSNKTHAHF
jgi:hypothetical protein